MCLHDFFFPHQVSISYVRQSERLDELPADAEELSFGNSIYKIQFEQREQQPLFGHKYWFYLQDAVENVPEYVVHWDNFVQCVVSPQVQLFVTSSPTSSQDGR